jgi:alkanesulfonate monooxygenase SsuD/methylene tetrahydromethanopterin reductase-like flavin-dependent oxidoreductase (luciferase family)
MKTIGFLSFAHWTPSPPSQAQTSADVLLQSVDLAVEAERLGVDGAYFRVRHFARQLASPFPLLAAVGARTKKFEIGPGVMRNRIWWGAGNNATAVWAAKLGMNLQSSTLKFDETGEPFHVQQAN